MLAVRCAVETVTMVVGLVLFQCHALATASTLTIGLPRSVPAGSRSDAASVATLVEGLSGGALGIEIRRGDRSCGNPATCLRSLMAGDIDVLPVTPADLKDLFPELQVLDLPYLFEDQAVAERVFDGPFYDRLREAIRDHTGLQLVALSTKRGFRVFATTTRAIRTPEDVAGLALGTGRSQIESNLVEAFGGVATSHPASELVTVFENGVIDGATIPAADFEGTGATTQARYVTLDRHSVAITLWLLNPDALDGLSANVRQVIQVGFDEVTRLGRGSPGAQSADMWRRFEATGGEVFALTPTERLRFLMAAGHVAAEYVETFGADWLVWLEAAIAEAEDELGVGARHSAPE